MLGELYLARKEPDGFKGNQYTQSGSRQNDGYQTAQQIADEYKVSGRTVERAAEYAKAVDKIAKNIGEEAKDKILNGDIQATRAEIIEIAGKGSPEKQAKILDDLEKAEGKTSRVHMKSMELIEEDKDRPHISYNSGENEWYTPEEYIIAAKLVMGWIDLDPASSQQANIIVGANKIFTVDDDGLNQNWSGKVWLNPPYEGRLISLFCDKLICHFSLSEVTEALILVNNATETEWFYKLIMTSSAVIFPKRRVRFYAPDGRLAAPLQGQSVIYMGCNPDLFLKHFKPFGWGSKL
jgi:ParB family chromosome partitioning protein